jgi:hypothetical protein
LVKTDTFRFTRIREITNLAQRQRPFLQRTNWTLPSFATENNSIVSWWQAEREITSTVIQSKS